MQRTYSISFYVAESWMAVRPYLLCNSSSYIRKLISRHKAKHHIGFASNSTMLSNLLQRSGTLGYFGVCSYPCCFEISFRDIYICARILLSFNVKSVAAQFAFMLSNSLKILSLFLLLQIFISAFIGIWWRRYVVSFLSFSAISLCTYFYYYGLFLEVNHKYKAIRATALEAFSIGKLKVRNLADVLFFFF